MRSTSGSAAGWSAGIWWMLPRPVSYTHLDVYKRQDDSNGLDYVLVGDYYIPDLQLPEESRPIGRWGRMHRDYLQEYCPDRYDELLLSGKLWTYLANLDEQAQKRLDYICLLYTSRCV